MLRQLDITEVKVFKADSLGTVKRVLNGDGKKANCFSTGDINVGDYSFVAAAAKGNGIENFFHKIKQKPGKPFYFGRKESKLIFGLPGNQPRYLLVFMNM